MHDGQLLKEYVEQNSQAAFSTLVERYINLVYSICLREVRDSDLAQDVTQVVFLILAKKATALRGQNQLSGWLYKTARFACKDALKQERRRQYREHKAGEEIMHHAQIATQEVDWAEIEPALHGALDALNRQDRELVLQRFFQKKSLREVGASQGISEDAARMRVARALEKMRQHFKQQGFVLSVVTLSALLSSQVVQAAPISCVAATAALGSYFSSGATTVPAAGVIGKATVPSLFEGVTRSLFLSQLKLATILVIGTAVVGSGVVQSLYKAQARSVKPPVLPAKGRPLSLLAAPQPPQAQARASFPAIKAPALLSVSDAPAGAPAPRHGGRNEKLAKPARRVEKQREKQKLSHRVVKWQAVAPRPVRPLLATGDATPLPPMREHATLPVAPPQATSPHLALPVLPGVEGNEIKTEAAEPALESVVDEADHTSKILNARREKGVRDHGQGRGNGKGRGRGLGQIRGRGHTFGNNDASVQ